MSTQLQKITAQDVIELRRQLRPVRPAEEYNPKDDNDPKSWHLVLLNSTSVTPIACVSFYPSTFNDQPALEMKGYCINQNCTFNFAKQLLAKSEEILKRGTETRLLHTQINLGKLDSFKTLGWFDVPIDIPSPDGYTRTMVKAL